MATVISQVTFPTPFEIVEGSRAYTVWRCGSDGVGNIFLTDGVILFVLAPATAYSSHKMVYVWPPAGTIARS
jgi:hypothetical protein